ncbi:MAG TPA: mycothiol system anti-sigma-R factor [Acidimicrobiales bacterium]
MTSHVPEVDCTQTVEWLYEFLDGELTEERRIAIEIHLNFCPPCGSVVSFESELRRVIADRCRDQLPDQLRERIQAALAELGEQASN